MESKKEIIDKGKCMTIQEFINAFPNLNDYFKSADELLNHEKKIQLSEKLQDYYKLLNELINKYYPREEWPMPFSTSSGFSGDALASWGQIFAGRLLL